MGGTPHDQPWKWPAWLLLALSLPLVAGIAPPAADGDGHEGCRRCKGRGGKVCGEQAKWEANAEAGVLFCSVAAGCEDCDGTLLVDCPRCDGGPESMAVAERRAAIAEWVMESKWFGRGPVASVWPEPGRFATPTGIRTVFSRNASHMLVSDLFRESDVSAHGGGRLDAGVEHWHEGARFGRTVNDCVEEANSLDRVSKGTRRAAIRKMCERASREGGALLPPLLSKATTAMDAPEQAVCWFFCDWLVAGHPGAHGAMLVGLKNTEDVSTLFKEHLGGGALPIEDAWRQWVIATYPKKEKSR